MALFSDVLLTVDYDRTLTGPDSVVPERNWEAISYFVENGGAFTINTGRSTTTMRDLLYTFPANAPLLLYNGSAQWDKDHLIDLKIIDLDMWAVLDEVGENFPEMNLEIQATDNHYLLDARPEFAALYEKMHWGWAPAEHGKDYGPFIKFASYGPVRHPAMSNMYECSEEDQARFDQLDAFIRERWGDKVEVFRAAPRIIDVHAKGVSKGSAAVELKKKLGKKILVCVGDADNDITMLDAADYAFCPAQSVVADLYPNVCTCGEGAVADVIYKKIPEILGILP